MQVQILRSVKYGEDILPAGTQADIPEAEVRAHPELFKPVAAVQAERQRAHAQTAEQAERKREAHLRQRDALAEDSRAAQTAQAELLAKQAAQLAELAAAARAQAQRDARADTGTGGLLEPPIARPAAPASQTPVPRTAPAAPPAAPHPLLEEQQPEPSPREQAHASPAMAPHRRKRD
jgi:hypothetical protein